MSVFNFIALFGGLALFLYGMRIMGDELTKNSSSSLKKVMEKVSNNPFMGFILGLLVTAVIQSSTATIVLTSGLVAAGIISLHQSLGIIIGANVGTTITGQIIRLLDVDSSGAVWLNIFKPDTLAPLAAVLGILLIMAFKFKSSDSIGTAAMGFGILFTGLLAMSEAMEPLAQSGDIFLTFSNQPFLGFLAGLGVAFLLQSSSATIGIIQALSTTGQLQFSSIFLMLLGIYLGDCITTAIVCSIRSKADAKRIGVIHVMFNLAGGAIIIIAVYVMYYFGVFGKFWSAPINSGGIANVSTIFKLSTAVLLLPLCGVFEKISRKIIKDDPVKGKQGDDVVKLLGETLFDSPALALGSTHKAICAIAEQSCRNTSDAMSVVMSYDGDVVKRIDDDEEGIDNITDRVCHYMVRLSNHITKPTENDQLNYYIKCVTEFERIGDYAVNIKESAEALKEKGCEFSPSAKEELTLLKEAMEEIISYTCKTFIGEQVEEARHIEPVEEVIDDIVDRLRAHHIVRLRNGDCNIYNGIIFLDILSNVERISDHCSNIGVHTIFMGDNKITEDTQHSYIEQLHQGVSEEYNIEYNAARDKYFSRLGLIEENA